MKRVSKKSNKKKVKKLHLIFVPFILAIGAIVFALFRFGFDPELLTQLSFYANLANPSVRVVAVSAGLRQEQVGAFLAKKLDWDEAKQREFLSVPAGESAEAFEGRYFPKTYFIDKDAGPTEVRTTMLNEFETQVKKIKKAPTKQIINQKTATTIASIIQREAGGKHDMALISGIIWNRIFAGMKLQMDATLQYAKGSEEEGWWQKVHPTDKKIESPYNTYLYKGLPPSPIASPSLDAIKAVYNPTKTDCLFYLHDRKGKIHCTKTYEEHKANIARYY